MIEGSVDLSWLDDRELYITEFVEETNTIWCGGYWIENGMSVPDMPAECTKVLQTYDHLAPGWAHQIAEKFDWVTSKIITVNCVKPGRCIPPHTDKCFRLYNNQTDTENLIPVRINIFLQDHTIGHFLQVGNTIYSDYKKGDFIIIKKDVVHTISNTSNHNRYTMQITGFTQGDHTQ